MEKQELYHIQEKVIIAIQNGQWLKIKNKKHQLHGHLSSIVLISMKGLHWLMEELELFLIQEKDITATQNGQWHKIKNKRLQLHGPHLNTAQILMRDLLL